MDIITSSNFQLIRSDFRELKVYIFKDDSINDWDKIILIYNFYLFVNHLYITYYLLDIITKDKSDFIHQFKNIYLFFFILCNLKNSYLYFIFNVSKIDKNLANRLFLHSKDYFM
jgi:hypothetical protein